jgi:hypothetical protein
LSERFDFENIDAGIRGAVEVLRGSGVETFESCEGGAGHAYAEPAVRFYGNKNAGLRALAVALDYGLPVLYLRRLWPVLDGELTGPYWELTFREKVVSRV